MASEAAANADFSQIRYAQCWEDADVLLDALDVQAGDTCLSIASAGDNSLSGKREKRGERDRSGSLMTGRNIDII